MTVPYCDLTSEQMLLWTSLSFQITSDIKNVWFFQQQRIAFFCFFLPSWFSSSQHSLMSQIMKKQSVFKRLNWFANFPTFICKHALSRIRTGDHQYFCEPNWKWKQTNMQKLMGNARSQTSVSRNWKDTRKTWENTIVQRSLLATRFMLELQKLLIKYSNKEVHLLLGSFPFFITCSFLHGNYGWRLGASSNRRITVNKIGLTL